MILSSVVISSLALLAPLAGAAPAETAAETAEPTAIALPESIEVSTPGEEPASEPEPEPELEPELEPEPEPAPVAAPQVEPIPVPGPDDRPKGAHVRASVDEGFGFDSNDGRFGLSLGILGQVRYSVEEQGGDVNPGFSLRIARTMFQGHLWGQRLTFQFQPDFAGTARLLDAVAIVNIHPAFSVMVGQYRPWFTRAFPTNLPVQASLDRGAVLDAFRIDRDVGVTVTGQPFEGRLEYYVGVFDGEGLDRSAPRDPQPLVTSRLVAAPLGAVAYDQTVAATATANLPFRFAVAGNAATNEIARVGTIIDSDTGETTTGPLPRLRTIVFSGDVALQWWRLVGLGEGFWRADRFRGAGRDDAWGGYGTLSVNVLRKRFDIVARAGAMRLEGETAAHMPLEPGVNLYFVGNHAKLQLRYRCDLGLAGGGCISQGAQLQGQVWF